MLHADTSREPAKWRVTVSKKVMVYDVVFIVFGELRFLDVTPLNYLNYFENQI